MTTSLLNIIADEARSAGAEAEWVDVNKLSIEPCIGCLKCRPDKKCILPRDDGHRLGELFESCSALVVGAPNYWGSMPGTLKILLERIVPVLEYYELYTWRLPRPRHKGKKAAIVTSSLSPFPYNLLPSQGGGALRTVRTILNTAGFDIMEQINVPMTRDLAQIGERWLEKARRLGGEMGSWEKEHGLFVPKQ